MNPLCRTTCILVYSTISLWTAATANAQDGKPDEMDSIPLTKGLVLSRAAEGGRIPLHRDVVEATLLDDPEHLFSEGDSLQVSPDTTRSWEAVSADENGRFSGREFFRSYLQFKVECETPRIMLLDAHGHGSAVINGQPRGGDTYNWWHQLPIRLKRGTNQLLFKVSRGRFRGKLVTPPDDVYLAHHDHTLPDWVRGTTEPLHAAIPIINASDETLSDLQIQASVEGGEKRTTSVGPVIPMTLRKVGFQIPPAGDVTGEINELAIEVKLLRRGDQEPLDVQQIKLRVRGPQDRHRRTFVSEMDGSVQYYGVTPAKRSSNEEVANADGQNEEKAKPGIYLTLHGAGVEGMRQAGVYQPKPDGHVIAPTNRRSFGFDWEDWGRGDALEVLAEATRQYDVDDQRIFLTGHSMGGHGTWHIGATFPDRFAAIGPSAGWISFWSYAGGRRTSDPTPVVEKLERAANPSDTIELARNFASHGVYILHGSEDNNVPVEQAREMRRVLAEFHPDFAYYEQPGAGHWWGNRCCDWPRMFDFFRYHQTPKITELNQIDFTTMCPGISHKYGWASVTDQATPMRASRIQLDLNRETLKLQGKTDNVSVLHLNLPAAFGNASVDGKLEVELDESQLELPIEDVWLARTGDQWQRADRPPRAHKGPHRYGLFKSAFDHRFVFVYGTNGNQAENSWALSKARYDAETFWYRGNGTVEIIPDHQFEPERFPERNVMLYGNGDTNSAWAGLLGDCPLQVTRKSISLGEQEATDPRLAALFVYPRRDSDHALIGAVSGTGIEGLRSTNQLRYFVSGVAYPDITIFSADFLKSGNDAVMAAGYWNSQWQVDDADIVWK